jgi:hypothetical protein
MHVSVSLELKYMTLDLKLVRERAKNFPQMD